ncbi:MAG: hypothetical protein HOI35_07560 [Woeseia sp.]|jgi:hypothetical protein|nr:hypothetical protein [Woeseia sp.]MBT6209861.1 hypothetical protein [Woeseia sp.]
MTKLKTAALLAVFSLSLMGCQAEAPPAVTDYVAATVDVDSSVPMVSSSGTQAIGKPGAPVEISYEVIGNPIVGVPVSINVVVTSSAGPLQVHYSINDQSALIFQDGQVERLEIIDPSAGSLQQLTVVPQREGRLYINVSAEVKAPMGTMIRSMAIPIKVGRAPTSLPINGEVKQGPDAEVVVSMPATPSN